MKKKLFKESGSFKQRFLKMLNKEGFYVGIFLSITLIATMVVYFTNSNFNNNLARDDENVVIESPETQDVSRVIEEEPEEPKEPEETTEEKETTNETEPTEPEQTEQKTTTPQTSDPLKDIVNPVSSDEVVMAFSMGGAPVYSVTLNEFRSDHSGVDLKADIGQDVKAAIDGKVIKIYNDNKLGQTIVIQHTDKVETRYSNLEEKVSVTLNESVKAGQVIGKVGKTATFESEEDPHLHFEIWKDGKCLDPSEYLK
ncbi:peptidoglycan DD-metalloendopeptidase family protein [Alkalibaculum sp. M08DMB]|uniref:Peptidoglycan DD-metalloendopeptidase family protein n=1 Tax=Alkalibaculum sporogenes TaxID=2655001 RepID=A0A6A7KBR6_9FIRM|nr:M23 family metallopeptidase [Alkalibaculum sporogenes]MPW26990.1 peptidoglycan DD-metalloendopeptidase family protein [Alkalibaculum sporogenes]